MNEPDLTAVIDIQIPCVREVLLSLPRADLFVEYSAQLLKSPNPDEGSEAMVEQIIADRRRQAMNRV